MELRWKRRRRLVAIHKGGRISSLQPLRAFYISLLYGKQLYTYTRMNVYIMGIALAVPRAILFGLRAHLDRCWR